MRGEGSRKDGRGGEEREKGSGGEERQERGGVGMGGGEEGDRREDG